MSKMEHEMTQLTSERDELVAQLEKSQELLLQFQKELNQRVNVASPELLNGSLKIYTK